MRRVADIDLLDDEALLTRMSWASVMVVVVGVVVGVLAWACGVWSDRVDLAWVALVVVASLVALPVHELVHGALFKLLGGPKAHVSFGARWGMLYTSAEGLIMPRRRFMVVLMGPAVLVTLALVLVCDALGLPLAAWVVAVLHLSGCTGDLGFVGIIHRSDATFVQDTNKGIALYVDDGGEFADGGDEPETSESSKTPEPPESSETTEPTESSLSTGTSEPSESSKSLRG